jgi:hypothetical protein
MLENSFENMSPGDPQPVAGIGRREPLQRGGKVAAVAAVASVFSPFVLPVQLGLRMLPALVHHLDAVAIGVENVGSVIARIVVKARARLAVVRGPRRDGGRIKGIDLRLILGDETNMKGPGIGSAMPQPKEYPAVSAEALQIRVALRTVRAVIVDGVADAKRR